MRLIAIIFSTIIILLTTGSCILPYEFVVKEYDEVIVVDGVVTTENKKHTVRLGYTTPIFSEAQPTLQGAEVWVESSAGTIYNFIEETPGNYQSEIAFAASTENEYQLFFRTTGGQLYQSGRSKPIPAPPIDSIYDRYAELIPVNSTELDMGIQFFLDSHDTTGLAQHFRYEWEETYQIVTPYTSVFEYDFDNGEIVNREVLYNVCYSGNGSNSLIIGTTKSAATSRMAEFPIQFVSGRTDILRNRYSLLVRQFAINSNTYEYYRRLKESESQGTLFDQQQGSLVGNIVAVSDPREIVLGNFEVSGVSSLRVFFSANELDGRFVPPAFRFRCVEEDNLTLSVIEAQEYLESGSHNIIELVPTEFGPPVVVVALEKCTDCRGYASAEKPGFWED